MNIKTILAAALAIAATGIFAAEDTAPASDQSTTTNAPAKVKLPRGMRRYGGIIQVPNSQKGTILIVNAQKTLPLDNIRAGMDEFAQTIRDLAKERGIECFDVNAYMKAVGKLPLGEKYMADTAHPNAAGHKFIADKLCEFLIGKAGIKDPKPVPPPKPVVPKGKAYSWDFEDGQGDWTLEQNVSISGDRVKGGAKAIKMVCVEDKKDYVRAWSGYLPVVEGQKYTASIDLAADLTKGVARVYVVEYANNDNKYGAMTVVGSSTDPDWKFFKKSYEVPAKVNFLRILVWVEKTAIGTVYADNVKITPEE